MKQLIIFCISILVVTLTSAHAQVGHVMQGIGSVNMSMGGAATGQPTDISGALQWNPATITTFNSNVVKLDMGLFFSAPELSSSVPEFGADGQPTGNIFSGKTMDDRGLSVMPSLSAVWGSEGSRHKFGLSAFGISGFGVTFPENMSNPINMPQRFGGFGHIESEYVLLQTSFSYAYKLSQNLSFGIQPNFNFAQLELAPNPTADPSQAGYPVTDRASAIGYGAQFGLFLDTEAGFSAGISYKTTQFFSDFDFSNTYLDNSTSQNSFNMDYPAIASVGLGYSTELMDLALDYRFINYENTDGFSESGWTQTGSVAGFGWKNVSVISTGLQYKGIQNLPVRVGYTFSSNPIGQDEVFFNIPATAVIQNALQVGFSYIQSESFSLHMAYHHGSSGGSTSGQVLNPNFVSAASPYGAIPGSKVSYDMTTDLIMAGFVYQFGSK